VLFAHDSSTLPIGGCLSINVEPGRLKSTLAFAPPDTNDLASEVQASVDNGLLSGISVGFRPLEWTFLDKDGYGIRFIHSELLEQSWCAIPANSDCGLIRIGSGAKSASATPRLDAARARLAAMGGRR
jgi:HK97 family phage prohead protease